MLLKIKNSYSIPKMSAWKVGSIAFALLFLSSCSWFCPNSSKITITKDSVITEIRRDTVFIKTKPEIHYTNDTIIQTKPFVWQIDTVMKRVFHNKTIYDTLKIMYSFPDNNFQLQSKSSKDTLWKHYERIKELQTKELSFLEKVKDGLVYFILGLVFSAIVYFGFRSRL